MQKYEAAVILMLKNLDNIIFLTSSNFCEEEFLKLGPQICFDNKTISYLDALSKKISKLNNLREYPDVASFGFFCRKANLINIKKSSHLVENEVKVGRGIVFHISPSNFPVKAGLSVRGEAKNWEKCGSWAIEEVATIRQKTTSRYFFIIWLYRN